MPRCYKCDKPVEHDCEIIRGVGKGHYVCDEHVEEYRRLLAPTIP